VRGTAVQAAGRAGLAAALALLLAACAPMVAVDPPPTAVAAVAPAPEPGSASDRVRTHFARQEATLRARGLMRTDGGSADAPFGVATLVQNFERIALYDEYVEVGGRLLSRETPSRLRRWESPVRIGVEFGAAVPEDQRVRDLASLGGLTARLARLTGHPITLVEDNRAANFRVLVLTEEERRAYGPRLAAMLPGIDALSLRTVTGMPLSASCLVLAFARGGTSTYTQAVAVVRAELPDLTRLSCFHEEVSQGLGLPNDYAGARPSIFNDVQEFALLTGHDEMLLRILYDARLRPGMTPPEARPIVQAIATELLGGES
jgi:hypothetical protein